MSAPTALYRRYRPDSFAQVIGQEHVTAPLMAALDKNRVNHAYLFSGPRGCGKTTSARILARCLNCAQGPTSHPCGQCESCIELARGGSGSLDVIEIDAASHGGVDDARDLRERATFAPIRDRYKVFIIDEAHMVTSAGFNALLKIVEEPPEHIKFIFATTEPDKVIGTIRSRTHHYPFRLVPPEPLMAYLAQLCEQENVAVAPGVLSLVVRAGGGSVRDSLSVLDQLMAGAGNAGLDYDLAVDLLGYTHASLLDDIVEALAAGDSATVFKSVDNVIQTGHDPRRFVEDLLERFRDLIIVQAMPESAHAILRGTPDELIARMQSQAAQLGAAELSRAADVTNTAFNEMTGATSPRLHLELLGARLLLPGAEAGARGMAARLDQLERRLNYGGVPAQEQRVPAQAAAPVSSSTPSPALSAPSSSGGGLAAVRAQLARNKAAAGADVAARHAPAALENAPAEQVQQVQQVQPSHSAPATSWDDLPTPAGTPEFESPHFDSPAPAQHGAAVQPPQSQPVHQQQAAAPAPVQAARVQAVPTQSAPAQPAPAQSAPAQPAPAQSAPAQPAPAQSALAQSGNASGIEVIRRAWPEILTALQNIRKLSWVMVSQNVVPQVFDGRELRVGLATSALMATFANGGHLQNLQQAIHQVLGMAVDILPAEGEAPKGSAEPNPKAPAESLPQNTGGNTSSAPAPNPGLTIDAPATQPVTRTEAQRPALTAAEIPQTAAAQQPLAAVPVREQQVGQQPVRVQPTAPSQPMPSQTQQPQQAVSSVDSWGLPTSAAPVQQSSSEVAPAPSQVQAAALPAGQVPAQEQRPWDGPSEPTEPWDEPEHFEEPQSGRFEESAARPVAAQVQAPAAYTPPKVSPISAWTTGWDASLQADSPVQQPAVPATSISPGSAAQPSRSAMLAEQIARNASAPSSEETPQDWGVSLGTAGRQHVADPGWGSMSNAPDWAQGNTDSAPKPSAADLAARIKAIEDQSPPLKRPAESPVASVETSQASQAGEAGEAPFNAALPVDGSPLGASNTYPTVPTVTVPLAELAQQQQEAPASSMEAGGEQKLSMYQRLSNQSAAHHERPRTPAATAQTPYVEDIPSPDDVTIEESNVVGQGAVERILGGVLIEERPLHSSD